MQIPGSEINKSDRIVRTLNGGFVQVRSAHNPDFIYLEDQVDLAEKSRMIKALPLNEKARLAMRESQEAKALAIENKRRVARGEDPLAALKEDEAAEDDEAADPDSPEEEAEDGDVLLSEAGNVLVDAVLLKQQRYALHNRESK